MTKVWSKFDHFVRLVLKGLTEQAVFFIRHGNCIKFDFWKNSEIKIYYAKCYKNSLD